MNTLPDGSKWAAVKFLGYETRIVTETSPGISETYTARLMAFVCQCGKVWEIPARDWKGKRALQDCGCGAGKAQRKAILSVYVPVKLLDVLDECARGLTAGNRSEAVTALLQAGINKWSATGEL